MVYQLRVLYRCADHADNCTATVFAHGRYLRTEGGAAARARALARIVVNERANVNALGALLHGESDRGLALWNMTVPVPPRTQAIRMKL